MQPEIVADFFHAVSAAKINIRNSEAVGRVRRANPLRHRFSTGHSARRNPPFGKLADELNYCRLLTQYIGALRETFRSVNMRSGINGIMTRILITFITILPTMAGCRALPIGRIRVSTVSSDWDYIHWNGLPR